MDTTVEIANKVGAAEIASRIVEDLKDENEQYRKMVMDCIEKVGVALISRDFPIIACKLPYVCFYVVPS